VDALARFGGVDDVLLVPDDRPAYDTAMLAGRLLIEVVPSSPARRPLIELAATLEAELAAGPAVLSARQGSSARYRSSASFL
jgi:hypothetical protein